MEDTRAGDDWFIGPLEVGSTEATANLLTRAHRAEEIRDLVDGPDEAIDLAVVCFAR